MKFPISISFAKASPPATTAMTRSLGANITWQQPPQRPLNYENLAREGMMRNELIWACIQQLVTSAAEPKLVAYNGDQKLDNHPVLDLLNRPNQFMSRYYLISCIWLYRAIAGNAFIEKVYDKAGRLVELWPLRPDRVEIIRNAKTFIDGYKYGWADNAVEYKTSDIIHSKNYSPLDNYYGIGPMQVLLSRTDTDNFMREFTKAFFFNAAVPAGLLNIKGVLEDEEKEMVRQRNRSQFSGPYGWHTDMVIEGVEATYTPMGMPMGARGIAYPELDEINEARICMVFGVPLSLVESRISMSKGGYAKKTEDRKSFWQETLMPMYRDLAETLTNALVYEFKGFDRLEFDMTTVAALQPDIDTLHTRIRANAAANIISKQEARVAMGFPREWDENDDWIPATNIVNQGPNEVAGETDPYPALPPKEPTESELINGPSQHTRFMLPGGINIWLPAGHG